MKKIFIILFMFSFFSKVIAGNNGTAYDYEFNSIDGDLIKLSQYKGKVIVVVNVASRCGYTPQYEDLQTLWSEYKSKNLVVLGIPTNNFRQEPGSNKDIKNFCETNFGITFPMTEKISVRGSNQHQLYKWLTSKDFNGRKSSSVKWNFQKYLVDKEGNLIDYWYSLTSPMSSKITNYIK